ncbi:hypothetical protein BpJC7_31920 [Weizmannia acidilactici]|jgi:uncharacterized membrane protein (UPF0182 family)|uniref:Uncharacterized protein n=1 Tax=Weizmannia acidilactici TaxID=2607726 RepID=A0A5J4JL04_9BACI|nr:MULTISPECIES: hypothetical protein [Heyndrickxia]MEC2306720.1 hypothetical protein [Weizmannia sp. CD-2023]MEC2342475.1 hypothetical protein [Weizmannia sp. CD-2023]MEC5270385.1 hypothetical protein [Heyndrickxia coagulans]GER71889.1 hypothetical protein BpJC7_31920 [Weizmannia acidilactici]
MENEKKLVNPSNATPPSEKNKGKNIFKAIGSILFAIIASSHHWVHTLLIALGLTTLGSGLLSLSPSIKITFMAISLMISIWMIWSAIRKWNHHRSTAWIYLVSSIISIVIVATALVQTVVEINQTPGQEPGQEIPMDHSQHHQ